MTPEQVDMMLRDYKRCAARRAHLNIEIEEMQQDMLRELEIAIGDEAIRPRLLSNTPHGTETGNPVEDLVLKYFDGFTPPIIQGMKDELTAMLHESALCSSCVRYVDGWMSALLERERDVINMQVIEGMYWNEILVKLSQRYGNVFSKGGLRKIKDRALSKIYAIAA